MSTILIILLSLSTGIGSTLLVQTLIVTPPPIVAVVPCPAERTLVEQALIDRATQPLPLEEYVPQGQLHDMPSLSGRRY